MVNLPTKKCPFCGHVWILRVTKPLRCPRCSHQLPNIEEKQS